jgi:hypothetical protein
LKILQLASGDLWAGAEAVVYELACGLKKQPEPELTTVFLNNRKGTSYIPFVKNCPGWVSTW